MALPALAAAALPAVISGVTGLIGGHQANQANAANTAAANAQSAANQAAANKAAQESAREQMAFQERMSNSAYQRSMEDMRKAGLNPMLAYQQGGASTPAGQAANMGATKFEAPEFNDPLAPAVNSAVDTYIKGGKLGVDKGQLGLNTSLNKADIELRTAQTVRELNSAKESEHRAQLLKDKLPKSALDRGFYDSEWGKSHYLYDKLSDSLGDTLDLANSAKDLVTPIRMPKDGKKLKIEKRLNKKTGEIESWTK